MVAAVNRSVFIPRLYHAQRVGRTQVPVRPSESVYAHLEHIEGIPSRSEAVPLIKLRLLDRLIDRLAGIGGDVPKDGAPAENPKNRVALSGPVAVYSRFMASAVEAGRLVNVFA